MTTTGARAIEPRLRCRLADPGPGHGNGAPRPAEPAANLAVRTLEAAMGSDIFAVPVAGPPQPSKMPRPLPAARFLFALAILVCATAAHAQDKGSIAGRVT